MLERIDARGERDPGAVLPRTLLDAESDDDVRHAVRSILADVRDRGDDAVLEHTARLDGVKLDSLEVPAREFKRALDDIPAEVRAALDAAAANVADFSRAEAAPDVTWRRDGLVVRSLRRPVDRAGCYVPGGRAAYPSTVLMTAVPARVAGVDEVVVCVPPGPGGRVPDVVLAAAAIAEVDRLFAAGGAQAVGALAYGTATVPAVDVIVGPGNRYVATAKREVAAEGRVGVPAAFAGPSEVVVIADADAPVDAAAIDLIVQAEHGPDGLAWLVTWSEEAAVRITDEVTRLAAAAPRRREIEATLRTNGRCVLVDGAEAALAVANAIAPEHLELLVNDPEALVPLVRHAGAVFLGAFAPAALGDYVAGPSHVLPTHRSARFSGALTVDDFTKAVHVVATDEAGFEKLAPHVAALAEAEGLAAHAQSVLLPRGRS